MLMPHFTIVPFSQNLPPTSGPILTGPPLGARIAEFQRSSFEATRLVIGDRSVVFPGIIYDFA